MNNVYVAVPFKGQSFMCVAGSRREEVLNRANRAWVMGYDELSRELFEEAKHSVGCAFEHRACTRR